MRSTGTSFKQSSIASTSKRRDQGSHASSSSPSKRPKATHPFFLKPSERPPDTTATFAWKKHYIDGTCLHGVHLDPQPSSKVAAFDLDGTLIKTRSGNDFPRDQNDWMWWNARVPQKLKSLHDDDGFAIVIVTNQAKRNKARDLWKQKIPLIAKQIPDVPFRIFAAFERDAFRKPMPRIWEEIEKNNQNVNIDRSQSFFVGDAAGRPGDHSDVDRKWALNLGIPFFTPQEYFLGSPPIPYKLKGFDATSYPTNLPIFTPTSTPLVPSNPKHPGLVLFVGYPASGKTSFYRRYFAPAGYEHVNQDLLKTRGKCKKAVEKFLKEGKSCVVDNTNRNVETRKVYIDICATLNIPVRCVHFTSSLQLCWHNNLYRAYCLSPDARARETSRALLPAVAFTSYKEDYMEPTLDEGFTEIKRVNWRFEGGEEDKKRWNMWLEIGHTDWLL